MILCVHCGNEMEDDAAQCPSCGTEVWALEEETETESVTLGDEEGQVEETQGEGEGTVEEPETEEGAEEGEAPEEEKSEAEEGAGEEEPEERAGEQEPAPAEEASAAEGTGEAGEDGEAKTEAPEETETEKAGSEEEPGEEPEEAVPGEGAGETEDAASGDIEAAADMALDAGGTEIAKTAGAPPDETVGIRKAIVAGALVCGILGVALFWVPAAGLALSIVAMVLGGKTRTRQSVWKRGMAVAGFVLGVIGLVAGIGTLIWWIVMLTSGAKVFWLLGALT